jgi:hypothetical protein
MNYAVDLAAMLLSIVSVILAFAALYAFAGITNTNTDSITKDKFDALYFSIVTWTTLGYGDFVPTPEMRMVAAAQAIIGYVSMAFFIALYINLFKSKTMSEKLEDGRMEAIQTEEGQDYSLFVVAYWCEDNKLARKHYEIYKKNIGKVVGRYGNKGAAEAEFNRLNSGVLKEG